jgi:DNA gyrase subunit A
LREYANIRANGLRAIVINPGDDLLSVHLTEGNRQVFMGTNRGMGIRFEETQARPMGRVTAGVRGINLRKGDFVEEVATVDPSEENDILVVTDLGFGKRTALNEFRLQKRGGYGVKLIHLTSKNGAVAGIRHVDESDQVMVLTEGGMVIRMKVNEIRRIGRSTQGVRIIRLEGEDRVASVAKLAEEEDGENGENGNGGEEGVTDGSSEGPHDG